MKFDQIKERLVKKGVDEFWASFVIHDLRFVQGTSGFEFRQFEINGILHNIFITFFFIWWLGCRMCL